jgi:hypothetical protein
MYGRDVFSRRLESFFGVVSTAAKELLKDDSWKDCKPLTPLTSSAPLPCQNRLFMRD